MKDKAIRKGYADVQPTAENSRPESRKVYPGAAGIFSPALIAPDTPTRKPVSIHHLRNRPGIPHDLQVGILGSASPLVNHSRLRNKRLLIGQRVSFRFWDERYHRQSEQVDEPEGHCRARISAQPGDDAAGQDRPKKTD